MVKSRFVRKTRDAAESLYAGHNRALIELAEKNEKIVSCYADFPPGQVGEVFQKQFPDRIIDVGIAEGHLITSAAGLADAGFIPFTHCHALFALGRGYNQIRQNLAYDKRNVKVVLCNAGVTWGGIGPSHLAVEDFAALRAIPNLVILSPSDAVSAEKATLAAAGYAGPVIIRLPAVGAVYPAIYTKALKFEIGKAICVHEGGDVAILATGIMVHDALLVAESLKKSGIRARVLDVHTIKPLDEKAILSAARETGAIVTVEDANILGGLGGAVAELTAEKCPVRIKRVGVKDEFGESGTAEEIKEHCGLTPPFIQDAVHQVLKAKRGRAATKKRKTPRR
jgi:transketolase